MIDKCPTCGGEVQASVKLHLSLVDGRWVNGFDTLVELPDQVSFYCENDHPLDAAISNKEWHRVVAAINKTITQGVR